LRIRYSRLATQVGGLRGAILRLRIQQAVNLDVDPAYEERRHALQAFQRPATSKPSLKPAQKSIEHSPISLDREDQRHVDGYSGG